MKDTLQYLMSLPKMTYKDTATFVRIMDQFQKLTQGKDPDIKPMSLERLRNIQSKKGQ